MECKGTVIGKQDAVDVQPPGYVRLARHPALVPAGLRDDPFGSERVAIGCCRPRGWTGDNQEEETVFYLHDEIGIEVL